MASFAVVLANGRTRGFAFAKRDTSDTTELIEAPNMNCHAQPWAVAPSPRGVQKGGPGCQRSPCNRCSQAAMMSVKRALGNRLYLQEHDFPLQLKALPLPHPVAASSRSLRGLK